MMRFQRILWSIMLGVTAVGFWTWLRPTAFT